MKYNLVQLGDKANITIVVDGEMHVATEENPRWNDIITKVLAGDESVVSLFNPIQEVERKFTALSDRLSVKGNQVYFDGDPINNALTDQIIAFMDSDEDLTPLVNFYEKLANNPQADSREQLYRWIQATNGVTITPAGDIVAYKGVYRNDDGYVEVHPEFEGFAYRSSSQGTATVDGEVKTGQIPQNIGSVVEMPRSEVTFDPSTACSKGLHAGTYEYAKGYGNVCLKVVINPRDVVSVPRDASNQKIRVCRYINLEETESRFEGPVYNVVNYSEPMLTDDDEDDELEAEHCGLCGDDNCEDEECADAPEDDAEDEGNSFYGYNAPSWY